MNDLRFALRQLARAPGFTAVALLTLALGIGACTTMFSMVYAVLLRPLPFRDPGRLVWVENTGAGGMSAITTRVDNLLDWRAQNTSFAELGAYFAFFDYMHNTLAGVGEPASLRGVGVSQDFLEVLGVRPALGRGFSAEECAWNGRKAIILSHALWRSRFGADPAVVGTAVNLNGDPTEIVGVLPASFDFDAIFSPGLRVDMLTPFPLTPETARWGNTLFAIGRLKPSATLAQARAEFVVINDRLRKSHPERGTDFGARMTGLEDSIRARVRPAFVILSLAVASLLLIACVNLSNLLLARANSRRKEFAVRVALGAGRWSLVRQALTESLLLAACGCALGGPIAIVAVPHLATVQAFNIPLLKTAEVNGAVIAFSVSVACAAGLLCGVLPALQHSGRDVRESLNEIGKGGSAGRRSASIRDALVVVEVAMACMLLIGASLLIRSFLGLLQVDPGFQARRTAAWRIDPVVSFSSEARRVDYFEELRRRVGAIPGVEAVGFTDTLPMGRNRQWNVRAKGETYAPGESPDVYPRLIDYGYLQAMGIPLRAGRLFDPRDTASSEKTIVINETMARLLWPGRNALGRVVENDGDWKVIGIVGDVRHAGLDTAPGPEMYHNMRQNGNWDTMEMVVRSSRPVPSLAPDVRGVIKEFDPRLVSTEFVTLDQIVDRTLASRRLITQLLGAFSSLGLILAALGLYGVIAYSIGQRTREIGVRMALGARRHSVLTMVVKQGARLTGLGVVLGLAGSIGLARLFQAVLFGVKPLDPVTFALIPAVLLLVAFVACWLPARRAALIDPMVALRTE